MRTASMVGRFRVIAAQTMLRLKNSGVEGYEKIHSSVINHAYDLVSETMTFTDAVQEIADALADEDSIFVTADGEFDQLSDAITSAFQTKDHVLIVRSDDEENDDLALDLTADIDRLSKKRRA